ncbi:MAG: family 16 glycoside hydrolase [Acidobacteriota bacterium]
MSKRIRGFRVLWFIGIGGLLLATLTPPFAYTAGAGEEGFRTLFNGGDLSGWEGNPKFWSVRDGAITGQTTTENPTENNTFLFWQDGTVEDFELRLSYRIVGGNSGIQYRSKDLGNWVAGGYQADIEAGQTYSGIVYEEKGRGILVQRGQRAVIDANGKIHAVGSVGDPQQLQAAIRNEDWNTYEVVALGNRLVHKINGRVMAELTDDQVDKRSFSGILALQLHAGPPMTVQFKDVRMKRLKAPGIKRIVMVAGTPSHGPGAHEFNAGVILLKKCLDGVNGLQAVRYLNGWPRDPSAFDQADSILLFMDGGSNHPVVQQDRLQTVGQLMKKGVGLACVHYAVEVPKENGGPEFLKWIGGYYETRFSTNPHWEAEIKNLPNHPITRGVKPFTLLDEWYYNMRFRPGMKGVTAILKAKPSDETRQGKTSSPRGPYPHIVADSGRDEVLSWAVERPDGGRGFGFTGAHFHQNWGDQNFRKLVLNALLWTARKEVPPDGVACPLSEADLKANLDPKPAK